MRCARSTTRCCRPNWRVSQPPGPGPLERPWTAPPGHSFGHGVGVEIHEGPNATPSNDKPLPAGAVISAEPGIYLPGKLGVRIEDVLYLTPEGCQNLTLAPKELVIL